MLYFFNLIYVYNVVIYLLYFFIFHRMMITISMTQIMIVMPETASRQALQSISLNQIDINSRNCHCVCHCVSHSLFAA